MSFRIAPSSSLRRGAVPFHTAMADADEYVLRPVGVVRSRLTDRADAPRQGDEGAPDAEIELAPAVAAGLVGIRAGDEIVVVTWLHEAAHDVLAVHPRDDLDRRITGVFNTRSSDRPNPLGLHRVTVLAVDARTVRVRPLEAIDGTPVVDLKPVLRAGDDS
jgi:tRNA-Thr(GGU) m(6)t(6)A37 methyltransferase TsaA